MATISLANLQQEIRQHLSVIGKRLYDKQGKNLFSNITASSAEGDVFDDYIAAAAQNLAGSLAQFVTAYTDTELTVSGLRWTTALTASVEKAARSYALLFSCGEFLAMTHPELAEKYYRDAQSMMATVVSTAFYKSPPQVASSNPNSISTTVTQN